MLFYVILLSIALGGALLSLHLTPPRQLLISKLVLVLLGSVAAIRGYVGTDTYSYHLHFGMIANAQNVVAMLLVTEPIFVILAKLISVLGGGGFQYIICIAVLQMILLIYVVDKIEYPAVFVIMYVATLYLDFHFNILRASVALLFVLAALVNLNKGFISYFPFLFAAFLSHYTAAFVLFYVVGYKLYLNKNYIWLLFCVAASVFFVYVFLIDLVVLKYSDHVDAEFRSDFGVGLLLLLFAYISISFLLWRNCRDLVVLFLFPVIFSRVLNLFFPEISHRILVYFLPAFLVLFLKQNSLVLKSKSILLKIAFFVLVALNLNGTLSTLASDVSWKHDDAHSASPYVPYTTLFGVSD